MPCMLITSQVNPSWQQWAWLACMGSNDFLAVAALNYAIAQADIGYLLPLGFCKYALIGLLGFWYFQETPTLIQSTGLILGLTSVYLLQRSSYRK